MDAQAKEETSGPLGVIGCLSAGFEIVSRHLWLIALPLLVDLFLWLGPRLSAAPLVDSLSTLLQARPTPDPALGQQLADAAQQLEQLASLFNLEQFNLLSIPGTLPLLNVPSLLAHHNPGAVSPLGEPPVFGITSEPTLVAWELGLVVLGLMLGFLYLNSVTRQVRDAHPSDEQVPAPSPSNRFRASAIGKLVRVFLFAAGVLLAGAMFIRPWATLVALSMAMSGPYAPLVLMLNTGLILYTTLYFLFVVPGVVLGERGLWRATLESIVLMHTQFSSLVGLVVLVLVIHSGLGFVWSLSPADSWLLLFGILGNACIATGLTAAVFVFYQERIGRLPGTRQISART
jgi:hypothetical protein